MFDVIGVLVDPGRTGAPGLEDIAPVVHQGWHVNTTPETMSMRPDLDPFVVTPTILRRVWAGDDPAGPVLTVALCFADEVEALAVLDLTVD